ncbi:flagellar export chaperone FliS [Pseudidiomarina insulisalsae]|uniref:Flagellar secretion chaperone FliS n=1 Tax=Pseudidiomarina insulisalsae TaxID=575789 RepID=A0A432YE05_9GAMM|nr:flagellar export chaperone FliS [Pseudidiomarina insulisalsae]RUO59062.1 flagellar export chaperone FliS [Pseudidiomarina insulisalsae]
MRGAAAYGRVNVESEILSASPHRLIALLFEHALRAIRTAEVHMNNGDIKGKAEAITKALDIVSQGLLAAVDREQGQAIAERLAELYEYVCEQLLEANLRNDTVHLQNAEKVLEALSEGWHGIAGQANGAG